MARLLNGGKRPRRRWAWHLAALALVSLGQCGCSSFWEEVTRRDISINQKMTNLFTTQDPLVILHESKDGDLRAKALRSLKEPIANGGSEKDQEAILAILVTTAQSDTLPLCRVAAIQSLANFKDPRAVQGLIDAYYKATVFTPETATVVQCAALTGLGETKNPAAVDLLTRVVRAPSPALDVPEEEKQQEQDRRIAAARALGQFSHYQAAEALVHVLRTDKDVGLRQRAHESLVASTGKDLGYDPAGWDKLLNEHAWDGPVPPPASGNKINLAGHVQPK